MFGATPALGRLFTKQDDSPGAADTVILMAGYWRSRFGADPSAIGRRIMLDGKAREIIGVLPDSFRFLDQKPSLILPLQFDRAETAPRQLQLHRRRAAEARRHARAGDRRRRAPDSRSA